MRLGRFASRRRRICARFWVEEDLLRGLTPEFLNLKFTRQETLARARLDEVQAISDYNKSIASLYRAMGTGLQMKNINVTFE